MKKINMIINSIAAVAVTTVIASSVQAQFSLTSKTSPTLTSETLISAPTVEETKTALLLPAVQAAREAAKIEGLELLDRIGEYPVSPTTFFAKKPSGADIERLQTTAARLGKGSGTVFDGKLRPVTEGRLGMRSPDDASASFEVDQRTGNFLFNGGLAKYRAEHSSKGLPDEGEAEFLAQRALEELGFEINFNEVQLEHIGGLNMGVTDGSGGTKIFEKFKTVRFSRMLGGLPVDGDGRIVMQFGEQAALSSMVFQWPQIEAAELIPSKLLRDPREMKEGALAELQAMAKKAESSILTKVDLVLYDDGKGVMEPAYHIVMERQLDLGERETTMIPYDFYLPISAEPKAFFPHMEVAEVLPKGGESTVKLDNGSDE